MIEYTHERPLRVFESFAGYGSQAMALERLKEDYPDFDFEVVGISEIDKYAITAYNAVHGDTPNFGDIAKIDPKQLPDFDLFTFSSPCFPEGTLIYTNHGYKAIEDVAEGDYVLTHTNSFQKVYSTMTREYRGEMYSFNAMAVANLSCTDEHPFYVRREFREGHLGIRTFDAPEWRAAKDLTSDYYMGYAINTQSEYPQWEGIENNQWGHHRPENKLTPLFANKTFWYIMGRYLGDGWEKNSQSGNGIIICCSDRNEQSLIDALKALEWNYHKTSEQTVTKITICSNELNKFVDRYGYKAHGKVVDAETLALPVEELSGFMNGVLDSDGCRAQNGLFKVTTASEKLAYSLAQCVAKVYKRPMSVYFTPRAPQTIIEGRTVNQRDTYTVVWHEDQRKQDHAFYEEGYIWFPIKDIKHESKIQTVYNISVEVDESYTANGTIVHNCQDFSVAGLQKGGEEGSGTRSSLLWECEKIIAAKRPKYLLLENVKALVSKKFIGVFNKWLQRLEGYGYTTFWQVLNAKDYGILQNRERVFAISILKEDSGQTPHFDFPEPFRLDVRLKDVLEENVDECYFLSEERMKGIKWSTEKEKEKGNNFAFKPKQKDEIGNTVQTAPTSRKTDNFIIEDGERTK